MILCKWLLAALIPDVPEFIEEMDNRKETKMALVSEEF